VKRGRIRNKSVSPYLSSLEPTGKREGKTQGGRQDQREAELGGLVRPKDPGSLNQHLSIRKDRGLWAPKRSSVLFVPICEKKAGEIAARQANPSGWALPKLFNKEPKRGSVQPKKGLLSKRKEKGRMFNGAPIGISSVCKKTSNRPEGESTDG